LNLLEEKLILQQIVFIFKKICYLATRLS